MKGYLHMNRKITGILACIVLLFVVDMAVAQTPAQAVAHGKRTSRRRTAVVVSSATHAKDEQAAAAEQSTTTTTTTTEAAPAAEPAPAPATEPAPATQPAPAPQPASPGGALPIGTVVTALPGGCEPTPVDDVQYYHCGADYYRVAYQGNNLVYVTTDPPK